MPWLRIVMSPWTWIALAFIAISAYASVQHIGWQASKAELAQFRADTERLGAEAKVKAAQEAAQQAQNAQEVLSDLQTRHDALSARYASLRARSAGGSVPAISDAAPSLKACPAGESDAVARFLGEVDGRVIEILKAGDLEIAKYRELWELQQRNGRAEGHP